MTLLFAAFVVLYGITPRGKNDVELGIATSIREAFIEIPDEVPEDFRVRELFRGKVNFEKAKRDSHYNPAIKKFNRTQNIRGKDLDLNKIEVFLDKTSKGDGLQRSLRQSVSVSEYEFGISLQLLGTAFFEPGKSDISLEGKKLLKSIVPKIKDLKKTISVEGHTDQTSPLGGYNHMELSALRASNIRRFLY